MEYCKFIHYKIDEMDEYSNSEILAIKKYNDDRKEGLIPM